MRPQLRAVLIAALAIAVLAAGGCGSGADDGTLRVFAASSLRTVLPQIDSAPAYDFAGSDELATQIREGAPADVYVTASTRYADALHAEGLVDDPVVVATNRLVLIVPAGNPARITAIGDIATGGVRLVLAADGVPLGDYARSALAALGLEGALDNVVSFEADAAGVVGKVALGEADAGIVYATDAAAAGDAVTVLPVPAGAQPQIEYAIAVVTSAAHRDGATDFVARVTGPDGRAALRAAGFATP